MGLPRMFGGGVVRQSTAIYVFNGGIKRTVRGIQVRDGGVYRRIYDAFAPTVAPTNISHFKDPTPSGSPSQYRLSITYADPPNNALNPPDPLATEWYWRVMIKSPRYSGGTIFVPGTSFASVPFGTTTQFSGYIALLGDQWYCEVYLRRASNGQLGPLATTSVTTV